MEVSSNNHYAMPWLWEELSVADLEHYRYGIMHQKNLYRVVEVTENRPSRDTFLALQAAERPMGKIEASRFLATAFGMNRDHLFEQYDLEKDGTISFANSTQGMIYYQLAADFSNFVVAGDRLIRRMSEWVNALFGNGSQQRIYWREMTSCSFDKSLAYAFFDGYRDEIEHGFAPISIVNYDSDTKTVGAAVNLEAGILGRKKIKPSVKKRLREFRNQRLRDGLTPWVSVAGISHEYSDLATSLYAIFLYLMVDEAERRRSKVNYREIGSANCIVWDVGKDNLDYSTDRVYRIANDNDLKFVRNEIARLYRNLRDAGGRNEAKEGKIKSYYDLLIDNVIAGGSLFDSCEDK